MHHATSLSLSRDCASGAAEAGIVSETLADSVDRRTTPDSVRFAGHAATCRGDQTPFIGLPAMEGWWLMGGSGMGLPPASNGASA